MKTVLLALLLLSVGVNGLQLITNRSLLVTIAGAVDLFESLDAAPVYVHLEPGTGDVYVEVPYASGFKHFPKVCRPERKL